MSKLNNIEINGKTYTVCKECGAFVSSPRCLTCNPLNTSDSFMREELRKYYPKEVPAGAKRRNPTTITHHLLEYFFDRDTLIANRRYSEARDRELLVVRYRDHHRIINGHRLHNVQDADESLLGTYDGVTELLSMIPEEVIELFKYRG